MRATLVAMVAVVPCGCHFPTDLGGFEFRGGPIWPDNGIDDAAPRLHRVAVGDPMDDVPRRIAAAGGVDHSRFIGVIDYPRLSSWYILKDGTCLKVTPVADGESGRDVVGRLTLGEPGRGYGNWERWDSQPQRVVTEVPLK